MSLRHYVRENAKRRIAVMNNNTGWSGGLLNGCVSSAAAHMFAPSAASPYVRMSVDADASGVLRGDAPSTEQRS